MKFLLYSTDVKDILYDFSKCVICEEEKNRSRVGYSDAVFTLYTLKGTLNTMCCRILYNYLDYYMSGRMYRYRVELLKNGYDVYEVGGNRIFHLDSPVNSYHRHFLLYDGINGLVFVDSQTGIHKIKNIGEGVECSYDEYDMSIKLDNKEGIYFVSDLDYPDGGVMCYDSKSMTVIKTTDVRYYGLKKNQRIRSVLDSGVKIIFSSDDVAGEINSDCLIFCRDNYIHRIFSCETDNKVVNIYDNQRHIATVRGTGELLYTRSGLLFDGYLPIPVSKDTGIPYSLSRYRRDLLIGS